VVCVQGGATADQHRPRDQGSLAGSTVGGSG